MSLLTNYGENALADFFRGQGITLPSSWYLSFLTAYSDASPTEVSGIGLSRVAVARSLAAWAGTQGAGTTVASSGTSKQTSNNATVDMGTATGSATVPHIGFYDASSSGNCWFAFELDTPLNLINGSNPTFAAGEIAFLLGQGGAASNYLVNKLIDLLFRGQSYTYPSSLYAKLLASGTEVAGNGYARVAISTTNSNWSNTQSSGTGASSGTGGRIANAIAITFPQPTGSWGTVTTGGFNDASSGGNELWRSALTTSRSITASSTPPSFAVGTYGLTLG